MIFFFKCNASVVVFSLSLSLSVCGAVLCGEERSLHGKCANAIGEERSLHGKCANVISNARVTRQKRGQRPCRGVLAAGPL